ncbi:MAG: hypothetical protein GTO45_40470 [Candidatus Aminicenantes bacterium]|nr:hypothetical protein [Candidatus Aminicenantes bacterium]NIM84884.1 hypothetical protein [Candidatus Aminicenantes bacterium]NIN24392.1 hypothetical protein [Candidatus Aminicenantes bacterium]NIN48156.1 hypothetical protein [Candidatus Aminicenantes bacterium]NIN91059.1 hypothetical protein [Candidatus Aminicenantes bacterium]
MSIRKAILIFFVLSLSITLLVTAKDVPGIKMVYKYHMDAIMGQPAKDSEYIHYVSEAGVRTEQEEEFNLLFLSKDSKFYLVYPEKKEFSPVDLAAVKPMLDQMDAQMGEVVVEEKITGKKGKVGKWNTYEKYYKVKSNVFEFEMNGDFTTDMPRSKFLDKFWEETAKYQGGMGKFTLAIVNSKGYPAKFTGKLTMMGQTANSTSLTTVFEKTNLSADLFIIPKDYKEVPLNMMDFAKAFQ